MLHMASTRPVKQLAGTFEIGLTSKDRRVVAREKRTKIKARRMDGNVTKTSGLPQGVHGTPAFARSHVLTVGSVGDLVVQLMGKRIQRRTVMKKVVTFRKFIRQSKSPTFRDLITRVVTSIRRTITGHN